MIKKSSATGHEKARTWRALNLALPTGLEPAASPVTGERSDQLSYESRCSIHGTATAGRLAQKIS